MSPTPREIVIRCLQFERPPRLPRELWVLPWAVNRYPEAWSKLNRIFPSDFTTPEYFYPPSDRAQGDAYVAGTYRDEWGCIFQNLQDGIIGEVRDPIVRDIAEWRSVRPPYEQLPSEVTTPYDTIARLYEATDKFVLANCCPRPWERYQFLRGTQNALMDVMMPEAGFRNLLRVIHEFNLRELEFWASAKVDALRFMDDWGSQRQLLISPALWREYFKPLYREYCDIAKAAGKFVFMHSDGYIADIYPDLIEIGVDALNSQLFCMDMEDLGRQYKGRITFWGEIDRQHVLSSEDPEIGREAVRNMIRHLGDPRGGLIAQFEFGPGANPDTVLAVAEEFNQCHWK